MSLNLECGTDYSGVTLLQPYHKTEIYEHAKRLDMIDVNPQLDRDSFRRISMLKFKSDKEKVKNGKSPEVVSDRRLFPQVVSACKILDPCAKKSAVQLYVCTMGKLLSVLSHSPCQNRPVCALAQVNTIHWYFQTETSFTQESREKMNAGMNWNPK